MTKDVLVTFFKHSKKWGLHNVPFFKYMWNTVCYKYCKSSMKRRPKLKRMACWSLVNLQHVLVGGNNHAKKKGKPYETMNRLKLVLGMTRSKSGFKGLHGSRRVGKPGARFTKTAEHDIAGPPGSPRMADGSDPQKSEQCEGIHLLGRKVGTCRRVLSKKKSNMDITHTYPHNISQSITIL